MLIFRLGMRVGGQGGQRRIGFLYGTVWAPPLELSISLKVHLRCLQSLWMMNLKTINNTVLCVKGGADIWLPAPWSAALINHLWQHIMEAHLSEQISLPPYLYWHWVFSGIYICVKHHSVNVHQVWKRILNKTERLKEATTYYVWHKSRQMNSPVDRPV